MDAVLADPGTAPISHAERVLIGFVRSVNARSFELAPAEVEAVRAAGWTDEAIYDAITVCALFNFYNRWCDGTGVHAMPEEAHALGGRRMAQFGYAPPEE